MSPEIRRRLESQPFIPFTIYMADGKEYRVPTADHAHVHPTTLFVSVFTDDGLAYALPVRQISGWQSVEG